MSGNLAIYLESICETDPAMSEFHSFTVIVHRIVVRYRYRYGITVLRCNMNLDIMSITIHSDFLIHITIPVLLCHLHRCIHQWMSTMSVCRCYFHIHSRSW